MSPRSLAACLCLALAFPAGTAGAFEEPEVEVRLIGGGAVEERLLAGVEIVLPAGWKTYWRTAGDSGIPPRFDFSGSGNVAAVAVEWPAPELHHDDYGAVIGYEEEVVFPLLVTPEDPGTPVHLEVALDYAVCSEICVPMEAALAGDPAQARGRARIEAFRARVPVRLSGEEEPGRITAERREDGEGGVILLTLDMDAAEPVLLAERADGGYLPQPRRAGTAADGAHRYVIELEGSPSAKELSGAELRLTAVSPALSFEKAVTLD